MSYSPVTFSSLFGSNDSTTSSGQSDSPATDFLATLSRASSELNKTVDIGKADERLITFGQAAQAEEADLSAADQFRRIMGVYLTNLGQPDASAQAEAALSLSDFLNPAVEAGVDDDIFEEELNPDMMDSPDSSYTGGRFKVNFSLGQSEEVGRGVESFHFPRIVEKDGVYYGYFIDHSAGGGYEVGLATSTDGVNFDYQGKVLTKGDDFDAEQASFPSVSYDDDTGKWYMLYEGKSAEGDVNTVCLAESDDGLNWQKKGPIIKPGDAGKLSDVDVGTPTMFKENGTWHVYFHTYASDGRVRMAYGSGDSLDNLTISREPILDVDKRGIEGGTVGARSNVVKIGEYYYMAYEVSSAAKDFSQADWGTNLARAKSPGGPWEKMEGGPLLTNDEKGFGSDGPELLVQDDKLFLYYRQSDNTTARVEIKGLTDGQEVYRA